MLSTVRSLFISGKIGKVILVKLVILLILLLWFSLVAPPLRWEGERVVHIELTNHIHRLYREKVEKVLSECRDRLSWLKKGSRELFGTLLEDRLVVVIDTSASMKDRLELVKTKIQQLIEVSRNNCSNYFHNQHSPIVASLMKLRVVSHKFVGATEGERKVHNLPLQLLCSLMEGPPSAHFRAEPWGHLTVGGGADCRG